MASLGDNHTSSTPSLPQLHSTLTSLQTATHILAGLTHRNKNQHRGTKWWPAFNMLRRCLQKAILDLEAAIQRAEVVPTAKQRKAKAAKQPELDRVVERAAWMKAVLGPRAYEAFSQLTADRQFAQLGLVLIGVLAQVEAAMAPFVVPADPPKPRPEEETSGALGIGQRAVPKAVADAGGQNLDLGVAVSRDELDDGTYLQPSVEPISSPMPRLPSAKEDHDPKTTKSKKRKKAKGENNEPRPTTPELFSQNPEAAEKRIKPQPGVWKPGTAEPQTIGAEAKDPRKRKKAKIDDGSLRMSPKEPKTTTLGESKQVKESKKKQRKGGDGFDDLFSSLL